MKLKDLASELGISLESLQNFIYDFNIDLGGCIDEHFNLTEVFREFALKNKELLKKYALDHSKLKTLADIAQTIGVKEEDVLNFFVSNGVPEEAAKQLKTNLSSYLIHLYLGGTYSFIEEAFPETQNYADKSLWDIPICIFILPICLIRLSTKSSCKPGGFQNRREWYFTVLREVEKSIGQKKLLL